MKDDLLELYVRQFLESQPEQVQEAWQGGEPTLMGVEFFERMMALVEKYRRPGQRVEHSIQTNGTRLDDAWCEFFKQHGFLVGLSVDGPRRLHDTYRVDKGGRGTFGQVMRGWELLRSTRWRRIFCAPCMRRMWSTGWRCTVSFAMGWGRSLCSSSQLWSGSRRTWFR